MYQCEENNFFFSMNVRKKYHWLKYFIQNIERIIRIMKHEI